MLLTARQLSHRPGWPSVKSIYAYAKTGRLPAPIDSSIPVRSWRWSTHVVEQYERGEWSAPRPPKMRRVS